MMSISRKTALKAGRGLGVITKEKLFVNPLDELIGHEVGYQMTRIQIKEDHVMAALLGSLVVLYIIAFFTAGPMAA
jgi:hypothetical protein